VLFVAEAVSLAQVVRLRELASSLDPSRYAVTYASARFSPLVFADTSFERRVIRGVDPDELLARASRCQGLHDEATLLRYIADDLDLLHELEPDLVVGDLRLSLTVSASLARVPYAPLINAGAHTRCVEAQGSGASLAYPFLTIRRCAGSVSTA
jgi:UDP:flavonoid glycosyltransferase YjiC (YdhE family)